MLAVTLTISTLVSIMFFFVGGVVGWLAKEHVYTNNIAFTHPEMFDENGNVLPCLLYTSPSPRDATLSRMPSSA